MTLKEGFKQYNTDPCLLYIVTELGTVIVTVYVDDTLATRYTTELMNTISCINK